MKIDKLSIAALNDHKKIKLILKGGIEKKGDDTIGNDFYCNHRY